MSYFKITTDVAGQIGVHPRRVKIVTSQGSSTVTSSGWLNYVSKTQGFTILPTDIFDVVYSYSTTSGTGTYGEYLCTISAGNITLFPNVSSGNVTLPVVNGDIAIFDGTTGLIQDTGISSTAPIFLGNVQAGKSGTAGTLGSFPSAATSGELLLAAVTNSSGNFNTTISNASSVGQSQVVSIPDGGSATSNFIISKSAGTQHVTAGSLQVDAGNVSAGLAAGGTAGTFLSYPATGSKGALILAGVANTGNTNVTISNAAMGQASVISIPDPGASTANFILSASASAANQHVVSGGLAIDAGALISGIATGGQVGTLTLYPTTSSKGSLNLNAIANSGNTSTIIQNAAFAQASTLTIPDPGSASANFLLNSGAFVNNHLLSASGTAGLVADTGYVYPASDASANADATVLAAPMSSNGSKTLSFSNVLPRYATGSISLANFNLLYSTPIELIPTPGSGFMVVILQFGVEWVYGSAAPTAGGAVYLEYGNTAHGVNYATPSAGIPAAFFTGLSASSAITALGQINSTSGLATSVCGNAAINITNATQVFATGTGGSLNWYVWYQIVPIT